MVKSGEHSLKPKAKAFKSYHNDGADKSDEHDPKSPGDLKPTYTAENDSFKSSIGSAKKLKRKSVGGLAKCTTKEGESDAEDLIGCRIKVWWPMDKQFYEGTVKSYDPSKRKHVILYDDGDVEVLRLEKERWELIDKGRKSTKKMKHSKSLSSPEAPTGKKQRSSSGSASKKTKKIVNGKQSPGKHLKHGQKGASKSNLHQEDAKESSEISNPEETIISKAEMNSDDSEGEQAEGSNQIINKKKSNKKVKSVSRGKRPKKGKGMSKREQSDEEKEESDEEKQDYGERHSEDRETAPQGVRNDDEESSSKERDVDESSGDLRENVNGEEESGSEGNQNDSDGENSPKEVEKSHIESTSPDVAGNAEVSDDEPLSKWKRPSGKKSSGKKR